MNAGQRSFNPQIFKTCNYCGCGTFPTGSPEYSYLCTMWELAKIRYNDQVKKARDIARICLNLAVVGLFVAVLLSLACAIGTSGLLSPTCIALISSLGIGNAAICTFDYLNALNDAKDCMSSRLQQVCVLICSPTPVSNLPLSLPSSPSCQ